VNSNSKLTLTINATAWMLCLCLIQGPAYAWGDEGHEVVGLIADHYLDPAVRSRVQAILATDATQLTANDIAHEATWADKYRDSDRNTTKKRYDQTHNWHFVDLEIGAPNLSTACFGQPKLPAAAAASAGPANDCVVDKIVEFAAELKNPATDPQERLLALEFVLHFVGDVHQPLHASDDRDQGGNQKIVTAPGIRSNNLHHYWDTEFVAKLGTSDTEIAQRLIDGISDTQRAQWSSGKPADWAMESFSAAKDHAYGLLPAADARNHYQLSAAYVNDATTVAAAQLSKAGVRLAMVLNQALR
jgi:hypothetical protein